MPVFIPNDYLFETHKDKGADKAEIFAWAVRDAMSKASGVPTIENQSLKDKIAYDVELGQTHRKYD